MAQFLDARYWTTPLLMIGVTLAGRFVTVAASRFDVAMGPPILAKAMIVLLLVLGRRSLAKS